jgi:uncharacterized protein with PIN domain
MRAEILTLKLDKGLQELLPRNHRTSNEVVYPLLRRASIKDIIEALHIPHTEVGSIVHCGDEVSFHHIPEPGERFSLFSFFPGTDVTRPTRLRPDPVRKITFMVDINVGRLARFLRLSGIDTRYEPQLNESELAEQAAADRCILLSRNRDLLRRKIITWGHLVRAQQPEEQMAEVIILYGLQDALKPFSRCLDCNTLLQPVAKSVILHRLEPLTRKYYQTFHICPDCDHIYWRGSHHKHMEALLQRMRSK